MSLRWNTFCTDDSIWNDACDTLWSEKVDDCRPCVVLTFIQRYVPDRFKKLRAVSPKEAYVSSLLDSRRPHLHNEVCDTLDELR